MSAKTPTAHILSKSNDKEQDEVRIVCVQLLIDFTLISYDRNIFQKLLQPFTYICQIPGKNMRSKFSRAFNFWMKIPEDTLSKIEEIVDILHNCSLL